RRADGTVVLSKPTAQQELEESNRRDVNAAYRRTLRQQQRGAVSYVAGPLAAAGRQLRTSSPDVSPGWTQDEMWGSRSALGASKHHPNDKSTSESLDSPRDVVREGQIPTSRGDIDNLLLTACRPTRQTTSTAGLCQGTQELAPGATEGF